MENRSHALMTGLFTIALLIAAILFGIWFNRDRVKYEPYLIATSQSVPGLNPQAAVRYRGLEVGKVDDIDFDPKLAGQILIHLSIDPATPITKTTYATLGYQGVTGIAYIQLDDEATGSSELATSKANPSRIPLHPGLFDQLEKRGTAILGQAEEVTRKLNNFLNDDNQKKMLGAFSDVSDAAQSYRDLAARLDPAVQKIPALMEHGDQALRSVDTLATEANKVVVSLQGPNGAVQRLTASVDRATTSVEAVASGVELETLPGVTGLADETKSSMRAVRRTMNNLSDRPQSILFGAPATPPGPGEPGFDPSGK
jgi:phospholipid/cholesterol/gamma-HCH transport system substrate-binding protein